MSVTEFIFDEGVIGVMIGTMMAFGTTNFIKSIRINFINPFVLHLFRATRFGHSDGFGNVIASIIEFIIIIALVYLTYRFIIVKIFDGQFKKKEALKKEHDQREEDMRSNIQAIKRALVGFN